jgi:hypothetical protein
MRSGADTVRAYIAAVEAFDEAAVLPLLADGIEFIEQPNRLKPGGARRDFAAMRSGLVQGRQILRRQSYAIGNLIDGGNRIAVEARWEGELAIPLGTLKPGDCMGAHICMVFTLRDGLITSQTNYDCYEPF